MGNPYFWQIMLPGSAVGVIVGYATQRHAEAPPARQDRFLIPIQKRNSS